MVETTADIETGKQRGKPSSSKTSSRSTTLGGALTSPNVHFDDTTITSEDSETVNKKPSITSSSFPWKEGCKSVIAVSLAVSTATFVVTKPFSSNSQEYNTFTILNSLLISLGVGAASGAVFAGATALSYGIHKLWTWKDATTPKKINEQAEKLIPPDPHNNSININN